MMHHDHTPIRQTERFLPSELLQFLVRLEGCNSTNDIWDLLVRLGRDLGLTIVDYVYATDFKNWEQAQFIRTTIDSSWLEKVKRYPHIRETSAFRMHGCKYLTPVKVGAAYLDEMGEISEDKRRHILLSEEAGLHAGIAFPLRMGEPGQAACLIFGGHQSREEFDALLDRHGWTLHAAALSAHTRYTELFKFEFFDRNQLTEKQVELIRLVGEGLMDKQIAHELGISFSAVRQRLASVQLKTGAQNRADLAALAARVGLVRDPMLKAHADELTVFLCTGDNKTVEELRLSDTVTNHAAE